MEQKTKKALVLQLEFRSNVLYLW